jgi:hypothetical protein
MFDRILIGANREHTEAMRASISVTRAPREPDNELFDHGCDLVQAAVAIRCAAASREASRAVPAVLGCLESALEELLWATALLEESTAQTLSERAQHGVDPRATARSERMHRGYANLQLALADAERAASAARALSRRVLTR